MHTMQHRNMAEIPEQAFVSAQHIQKAAQLP